MDSNAFNRVRSKTYVMAQKLKAAKEFDDREFDDAMRLSLEEDADLLQRLAKV